MFFIQTLEDKALIWFNVLPANSITISGELISFFNGKYSTPIVNHTLLKDLTIISKNMDELFKDFNLGLDQTKTKILAILRRT